MRRPDVETVPPAERPKWREDFPVDAAEDAYVARRDFVKFLVLTSFAFVTGQAWILGQSLTRRAGAAPAALPIVRVDSLPVGGSKAFVYPGPDDTCLLVRVDESTYVAYSQKCTHLSCAVVPEPDKDRFFCPCHEGSFDMRTGRPLAGPPRRPLPKIAVEVRDGVVYATGVEERTA